MCGRLGQAPEEWLERARGAVLEYDRLVGQTARVADDDARGGILEWIGRADMPGMPAERYALVKQGLEAAAVPGGPGARGVYGDATGTARVARLEELDAEFGSMVERALAVYGALDPPGRGSGGTQTAALCVTGGIALLGLVAVPLLLD